jgi:hypothetical protein
MVFVSSATHGPTRYIQDMKSQMCVVVALMSFLAVPALAIAQTKPAGRPVTLTGKLSSGKVAVGGETTGWELSYHDKTGDHSVEVELTKALQAKVRDGQTVRITGTMVTRERVERGKVQTLVATAVESVKE